MTSTLPPLVQAFSGAIGSIVSNTLTYPLDLVITRLQLDPPNDSKRPGGVQGAIRILRRIVEKHGWGALYDGLWTDSCATFLSNLFYFYIYSFLRSLSTQRRISEIILGFIAGVASRAISTPLNIITLRLQREAEEDEESGDETSSNSSTITDVVKAIYKEKGLAGFWRGFETTAILSLNPSITLAFFQIFRRALDLTRPSPIVQNLNLNKQRSTTNPSPQEAFIGGAISNSIAVTLLYPLILAKTRVQASSGSSMTEVLVDAYHGKHLSRKHGEEIVENEVKDGIAGIYQGLEMKTLKGFIGQGVTFLVKGRIEQMIVAVYLQHRSLR
ncbi:mitochondrial carrier domain-containing protein [Crucibulum laeve]|uniref:Mitochondrial carrier domain-containing protein n=1 Tax=Crucibulum laeve TaxID=68775 RepID=A0A5C3MHW9_9AGAR|nr:mitochondrial carrier domain-containing protein [Crucibulum laeve]